MPSRRLIPSILAALALWSPVATADIYQWEWIDPDDHSQGRQQSSTLAPDGAGVDAVPSALLNNLDLTMAWLQGTDLANVLLSYSTLIDADLSQANLADARLWNATFTDTNFSQANLTNAVFHHATLTGANLNQANLTDAHLDDATLTEANLSQAILTNANLGDATLTGANFKQADLVNAYFNDATMTDADLDGAIIHGANFESTTDSGFVASQLYSTASYQTGDLFGIVLRDNYLSGWNFAGQNLSDVNFDEAMLPSAVFVQANLSNAIFEDVVAPDSSYYGAVSSNANFLNATLERADFRHASFFEADFRDSLLIDGDFERADLSASDFGGATLSGASFSEANLTQTDLSSATLLNVDFTRAEITGVNFSKTTGYSTGAATGFTQSQLYSTQSYQEGELTDIILDWNDLSEWNFSKVRFRDTSFISAKLTDADFSFADLSGEHIVDSELSRTIFHDANLTDSRIIPSIQRSSNNYMRADMRGAVISFLTVVPTYKTHNSIFPDGVVHGLNILPDETLRLWDYDTETPLPITVEDMMQVDATGALRVVIEDESWGSTMKFESGIDVLLDGTLELLVDPDESATLTNLIGTTFDLFDWTGVTPDGVFDEIATGEGLVWDTTNLYTTGDVTLLNVPGYLFGDFDNDGDADGIDFLTAQRGYGTSTDATGSDGDTDDDGDVDWVDLKNWEDRFGEALITPPSGLSATVAVTPEPSAVCLALIAVIALAARRPEQVRAVPADAK